MCRITRQRHLIRQQRISNMNAPLASQERPDFAKIENRAPSVAHMFLDRVAALPHTEAFRYPQDHSWESVNWQWVGERVYNIAGGLIALGIASEDRVALASSTSLRMGARRFRRDVRRRCDHHRLSDDKT